MNTGLGGRYSLKRGACFQAVYNSRPTLKYKEFLFLFLVLKHFCFIVLYAVSLPDFKNIFLWNSRATVFLLLLLFLLSLFYCIILLSHFISLFQLYIRRFLQWNREVKMYSEYFSLDCFCSKCELHLLGVYGLVTVVLSPISECTVLRKLSTSNFLDLEKSLQPTADKEPLT